MKVDNEMWVSHDNGCVLGQIFVDDTWKNVRFRPGKKNGHLGGNMDSKDLRDITKIMDGIKRSVFAESFISQIKKSL